MKTTKTTSLTNDEYRSTPHWSKSDLDNINLSPSVYEWNKNHPAPGSDSVDLGTHLHCALLEPDVFHRDYLKMPEFDNRSNAGKESRDKWLSTMSEMDKIILDRETYSTVIEMRDSALAHPTLNKLLTLDGESEVSIFSEINGMKVKCRPDRIPDREHFGAIILDIKKTADIETFAKSAIHFRYHVQAAFYSDIYKRLTGESPRFIFGVIGEKRSIGRHPVRVWELPEELIEMGRQAYLEDLETAREYQEFGCSFDVEKLFIPGYLIK